MKYYAYLRQNGEGCGYMIGCGETLIEFEAENDDEARIKLSEIITGNDDEGGYTDEQELSSAIILKDKIDFDLGSVYDGFKSSKEEEGKKMQHLKDKEEFEILKKKFGE